MHYSDSTFSETHLYHAKSEGHSRSLNHRKSDSFLLEPHGVCAQRTDLLLRLNNEAVLVLLSKLSGGADYLIDKPGQVHRLGIEFELAGFDLREVQYLVDEAQEMGPGSIHTAQRFQRLFRAEARRVG